MNHNTDESGAPRDDAASIDDVRNDLHFTESLLRRQDVVPSTDDAPIRKLLRVMEQLNSTHDVDRVLSMAAHRLIDIFSAERVFVLEVQPGEKFQFRLAVDCDGATVADPGKEVSHAVVSEVFRLRKPMLVRDAMADARFAGVSSVRNLQLHSVMAAPLLAMDILKGVVYVDNRRISGVFGPSSLDLLALFANQIGIALHNAQLFSELEVTRAALAQAERLKTLGQVAAYMAHEVKNPLAAIALAIEMMNKRGQYPEASERSRAIVSEEVARLNEIVNQMLGYARPTPLQKSRLRVGALLQSALRALEAEIVAAKVVVKLNAADGLPEVSADGQQLREVFVNLLKNAVEALGGCAAPRIAVAASFKHPATVEIVVEDNGPGFDEIDALQIFEPFRTTKRSGAGLGLAFCQKVVREHGGEITAESVSTGGARFRIHLPVSGA